MNFGTECYIFYDKYGGGSHSFKNPITSEYKIKELFETKLTDQKTEYLQGDVAVSKYNAKFGGTNFRIPSDVNDGIITIHTFTFANNSGCEVIMAIVGFDIPKLTKFYKENGTVPNSEFVLNACQYHINYEGFDVFDDYESESTVKSITQKVIIPNLDIMDPIIDNPPFIKEEKKLYDYQRRTIRWMLDTERNPVKIHYGTHHNFELEIGPLVFDTAKHAFLMKESQQYIEFNGGALIDEVGLGKTIQTLTTCILNPPLASETSYIDDTQKMFKSGATLILCPNHLTRQWVREIGIMTSKTGLKIVEILTKSHFEKYTYLDLLEADFVVVSYTFIGNYCFAKKYITELSTSKSYHKSTNWNVNSVASLFKKMAEKLISDPASLFSTEALFPLIYWYRVVIDEFHEPQVVDKYLYVKNIIPTIKGKHKWVVTGTPFDKDTNCFYKMFDFVTKYTNGLGGKIINIKGIKEHMLCNFFRRNTKKSVEEEFKLPELKEKLIWLRFTHTERMMYNAYLADPNVNKYSEIIRQICCNPKIADELKGVLSNCKTMDDIQKTMVLHYKRQYDKAFRNVKRCEKFIAKTERRILVTEYKRQRKYLKQRGYRVKIELEPFAFKDENLLIVDEDEDEIKIDNEDDKDDKSKKKKKEDPKKIQEEIELNAVIEHDDDNGLNINDLSDNEDDDDSKKPLMIVSNENQKSIMKLIKHQLDTNHSVAIQNFEETLKQQKNRLANLENICNGKRSRYNFFNNMSERIKKFVEKSNAKYERLIEKNRKKDEQGEDYISSDDDDEEDNDDDKCIICMSVISGENVGVTNCGHLFCFECLKMAVSNTHKCPMCMTPQANKDISMISFEKPVFTKQNSDILKSKLELIDRVGTKPTNVIYLLNAIGENEKVIIFAQWEQLLRTVGDVLTDHGIRNVFCRGNVWTRDKAIREFKTDPKIKVIMLSSESAASGANLTEASIVILLNPVSGDYEYRRNMEWQAIGRAYRLGQKKPVEIVRLIIKDTVEEDIYKANKIEDSKQKTQLNISEITDETITLSDDKLQTIASAVEKAKEEKENKAKEKLEKAKKKEAAIKEKNKNKKIATKVAMVAKKVIAVPKKKTVIRK